MPRKLKAYVHIGGKVYGPGDEVPASVAKQIGAHAWADSAQASSDEDAQPVNEPPRSGRGSGVEAWRAFAEQNGVGVDSDMDRDAIIRAVEAAGVIEPEPPKE